jgi:hypothetical protein
MLGSDGVGIISWIQRQTLRYILHICTHVRLVYVESEVKPE